ncbi:hypothetical protein WMO40_04070 [Bacillaceae bacterium CLA-AA-H227]|uniref:Uncharacterized protein n=1 Tax=Robertmurraya yapensis (ex Hitch et al 2024) TaxID=3133160 RepID=A0ACC6S727_9BACI
MINGKSPLVIAIAAISGGGKTTITKQLAQSLDNSRTLFFDDYDFKGPDDIVDWIENGGNPNEWNLAPLLKDLNLLLAEPLDFIILDFPFSYEHSLVTEFIDFSVFVDTPLDIAMARRILRDFREGSTEDILVDMEIYISRGRQAYLHMLQTIKPTADIVIDGTLPARDIIHVIMNHLELKKGLDN